MAKAQKSEFTPKHPEKYKGTYPIVARSSWELAVFTKFDLHPNVIQWASESVSIPYQNPITGKFARYVPDLLVVYLDKNNKQHAELIEIKPMRETLLERARTKRDKLSVAINTAKWRAAMAFCQRNNLKFRVLTEEQLFAGKHSK
ncbi:MAG: hypothetical protein HC836_32840 [Richelia sp. RM2_1_2]|nr:hypothetical protein [Richelia sp. RM2_1_2]